MEMISGKKQAIIAMLLLLGIVAAIAGCNKSSALVGKWEEIENGNSTGEIMEFFSDGTASLGGLMVEWAVEKSQLIFSAYGKTYPYDYKISGSTMTLSDDEGEELFKRVKK